MLVVGLAGCESPAPGHAPEADEPAGQAPADKQPADRQPADKQPAQENSVEGRGPESPASPDGDGAPGARDAPIRLLALGDSYTVGTGVERRHRWVARLVERLEAQQRRPVAEPTVVATAGWTTEQLDAGIARASPEGEFDVVTLLIGANNAFAGWSAERFRPEFVQNLRAAVDFAGGDPSQVVVMTLPDHSVTPAGRRAGAERARRRVERFNRVITEETTAAGARLVDLAPVSRRAKDRPGLIADDGLHPAPDMHALWTDELVPVVVEAAE